MNSAGRSLRTRFVVVFTLLIALSAAVLSIVIGNQAAEESEHKTGLLLTSRARHMVDKLDKSMWFWFKEIQILSSLPAVTRSTDPEEIRFILDSLKEAMPVFTWVGRADARGKVIEATDGILKGQNLSNRPVFVEGQKGPFIGDVHDAVLLAKLLPNPNGEAMKFVDISVPIHNATGQFTGVLAAHLSWTWAKDIQEFMLHDAANDTTLELFVIAKDGTVLLGQSDLLGQELKLPFLDIANSSAPSWNIITWPDGKQYLTGFARSGGYRDYSGLGWTVIARQPLDAAYASVRALMTKIFSTGIVLSIFFAAMSWIIAQRVIEPLKALTNAADRLSRGESVAIPEHRDIQEIEVLSNSISTLVSSLTKTEFDRDRIQSVAIRDHLTGLSNRLGLSAYLDTAIPRIARDGGTIDILYMDLDGFKPINDSLGHNAGDAVLIEISARMTHCLRSGDVLVRLGGDEFVALMESKIDSHSGVVSIAQRIIESVNQPIKIENTQVSVGISIGHANWPNDGEDFSTALAKADEILYEAKRHGKNRMLSSLPNKTL